MKNVIGIILSFLLTISILLMFINNKKLIALVEKSDFPQFLSVVLFFALPIVVSIFLLTIAKIFVQSPSYSQIIDMLVGFIGIVFCVSTSFGIGIDTGVIGQNGAFLLMLLFVYKTSSELSIMFKNRKKQTK